MATVQLETHEFEIRDHIHPYLRTLLRQRRKPYYINQIVVHGDVQDYTVWVQRPGTDSQPVFRAETDDENLEDPIRVEAGYEVYVEYHGPKSCEISLICSRGKRDDF
jgi:hypothetical protein